MIKNILKIIEDIKRTHSSNTIGLFHRARSTSPRPQGSSARMGKE